MNIFKEIRDRLRDDMVVSPDEEVSTVSARGIHDLALDHAIDIVCEIEDQHYAKLDFGLALQALKYGKRVARKGWNGKNQYIEMACNIGYENPNGKIVNPNHDAIGNCALAFVGTSGVQLGWLASQADMLAEDWFIVD